MNHFNRQNTIWCIFLKNDLAGRDIPQVVFVYIRMTEIFICQKSKGDF